MTGTQHLLKWFVTSFYNKFEVTLFMFKAFLEVFQINYYSTSEFITSEYSGIEVSACLWSPPVHICPLRPSQSTTGSARPQVPTGHHQHLHTSLPSPSLSLWWGRHSQGPPHSLSQPELRSPGQGQWLELSLCGYPLMAWTDHTQHLQFSSCPRPFTSPHCTVALMQKSQIGIESNPSPTVLSEPLNRFHLSHCSSLTVHVCGIPFMAEAAGRAAPEEEMPGLPGLCITECLSYA